MTTRTGGQTAALSTGALFDEIPALRHLDPADPYVAYREIAGEPLVVAGGDVVILTRWADCNYVLRHPDVSLRRNVTPAFRGLTSSFMNVLDPPEHTRIRSIVNKAFTPRSVELLKPWLQDQVHELLDASADATPFDVIEGLAYPLPLNAICQLLGVPIEDRRMIMGWSRPITIGADLLGGRRSREDQSLYRSTLRSFRLYTRELVEERRRSPGGDLLSRLIFTEVMGDRLTDREVMTTVMGLLITGHETTVSLIGHGAIALARHPALREHVAVDEAFADLFVEELLRYDSPVQATLRVAARDLSIGGVDIRAGSAILALLGAANRDLDQFSEADTFDVHRSNNRSHLAFGGGPHYCVGAPLGRLEARIAVGAMAGRWVNPRVRLQGVSYDKSVMLRTQSRLELDVESLLPRPASAVRT
jgi:cytochrome P450